MNNWYSILYRRIKQNDDIFIFIPVYYIKGSYEKSDKGFFDEGGNLYFNSDEFEIVTSSEEYTHYHTIHKEDLKNRYQSMAISDENLSEEECIGRYFEDIKDTILIGNLLSSEKQIDLISMPFEKWSELARRNFYLYEDGEGVLNITKSNIERLLLNNNPQQIVAELNGWLKHTKAIEKMAVQKGVHKVEMTSDSKSIVKIEMAARTSPQIVSLEEQIQPKIVARENGQYDSAKILKYITDRMVIIKDEETIKSVLALILGNLEATVPEEISHIFSIGPTGTGKTYIYKLLGKILDVPVIIEDCNNIVQEGYVGTSVEDLLVKIYMICDSNIEKANVHAIVYLDEIDKIAARGSNVSDIGAQSALLKFIEGSTYTITVDKISGKKVTIDTSMMSICAGGAFSELNLGKKNIGFNNEIHSKTIQPSLSDIVNYGLYPELIGRFTNFMYYDGYSKEEYRKVLLESLDSPYLMKQKEFLRRFNVSLDATDSFFDRITEVAKAKNTGFRGIKLAINTTLLPAQIKLQFTSSVYNKLIVSGETIDNPKQYILM